MACGGGPRVVHRQLPRSFIRKTVREPWWENGSLIFGIEGVVPWGRRRILVEEEEEFHIERWRGATYRGMENPTEKEELIMKELHLAWVCFGAQWRDETGSKLSWYKHVTSIHTRPRYRDPSCIKDSPSGMSTWCRLMSAPNKEKDKEKCNSPSESCTLDSSWWDPFHHSAVWCPIHAKGNRAMRTRNMPMCVWVVGQFP